jgi:hypothetical protein
MKEDNIQNTTDVEKPPVTGVILILDATVVTVVICIVAAILTLTQ